ncbi:hypothetical protein BGX31_009051 [Mortierella sp. GBA43]|nr:hypothetical protein BGX31_009051 [Mortierella sp. GBA43]
MMNDLNKHLERFEELNNQVLEAMTSYDRHNLGLDTDQGRLLSTPSAESLPPRSVGFETSSQDLERQRQATALSAAELIQALWPRLRPGSTSTDIHTPHMYQQTSSKAAKQRVKIATQLKNAITTLWSSQSLFQERAQLVLDIFQDPTELEREDGIRTLRSRHLNSLLSTTLSPTECDQLAQKFKDDQEKMALILDRLQGDWLGIMLILDNPDQGHSQSGKAANEGAQSDGDDTRESFGRRLLRISKDKREALKSIIKNW